MYKILIVEDDPVISRTIKEQLEQWGYDSFCVENFQQVAEQFLTYDPQLVLMDISLPFFNGYYWCGEIRKYSKVPILFISSTSDSMNIVMAMNMGADDFIVKPFDLNVLIAKVQAILRRTYDFSEHMQFLSYGNILLSLHDAVLIYENRRLELTKNEFKMLQMLFENKGCIVTREELMVRLWESDQFIDDNTLSVNMARLRKRMEGIGITDLIQTKKGMGYVVI